MSQLLVEGQAGSEAALAAFIRRSQPEIWRFCAPLVGPAHDDDAAQETYLSAWRALPSFRGESPARTWLLLVARRTAQRLGRRQLRLSELDRESSGPRSSPDPENWTELGSLSDQLDLDRRLAIVLTQILGRSYADAAEVPACAVGTIPSRVARARVDLLASSTTGDQAKSPKRRPRTIDTNATESIAATNNTGS